MGFWTKEAIQDYDRACRALRYPQSVAGDPIRKFIRPDDVVLDVGAGCGALTAFLAPLCQRVYALEPDDNAFQFIQTRIVQDRLDNVQAIQKSWPAVGLPRFSVFTAFYVGMIIKSAEQMKAVVETAERGGIFLVNRSMSPNALTAGVMRRIKAPYPPDACQCCNGCRLMGILDAMGVRMYCHSLTHDFGQPVNDEDGAAVFIWRMLHIDECYREPVRRIAREYMVEKEGQLFVPYQRESCLIFFEKEKN